MKKYTLIFVMAFVVMGLNNVTFARDNSKFKVSKTEIVPIVDMSYSAESAILTPAMEFDTTATAIMSEKVKESYLSPENGFDRSFISFEYKRWYSNGLVHNWTENYSSYLKSDYPIKQCFYHADALARK